MNRVVFLTNENPFPSKGSTKIRDAQLIKLIREKMEVEVLAFETPESKKPLWEAIPEGVQVTLVEPDQTPMWKKIASVLRPDVVSGYSKAMADALRTRAAPGRILWVSRLLMGHYVPLAKSLGYRIILDEHHSESGVMMEGALSSLRSFPGIFYAAQATYYESRFCKQSHAVIASSHIDASRLTKVAPGAPIHVLPHSVDSHLYDSIRTHPGTTFFFSGNLSESANLEGIHWFIDEILPRLRAALGKKLPRIVVAGSHLADKTRIHLTESGLEVHEDPPSILPFLSEAAVAFFPLRSGNGTRFKILEAMAAGRAIVSTGKAAEGLTLSPSFDIFIADRADHFTSSLLRLLDNAELRAEIGIHAVKTVEARYDWRCARPTIESLFASVLGQPIGSDADQNRKLLRMIKSKK